MNAASVREKVGSLQTRDPDTIDVVEAYRQRKNIPTASKALEKLVARAKEAGLHLHDEPVIPSRVPVAGTVQN